jgi:hypothetical protein
MLEAIGGLTVFGLIIYLFVMYQTSQDDKKRNREKLVPYSDACQGLIRKYNREISDGKHSMDYYDLTKQLDKILSDPEELREINRRIESSEKRKQEWEIKRKESRKIGYKYEDDIFELFDTDRELSELDILLRLPEKYKVKTQDDFKSLLKIWEENDLVEKCHWNKEKWQIGNTLTSEFTKLFPSDITRNEWLEQHNKTLKENSKEYDEYLNDLPF